jgi:hypothetical protein
MPQIMLRPCIGRTMGKCRARVKTKVKSAGGAAANFLALGASGKIALASRKIALAPALEFG